MRHSTRTRVFVDTDVLFSAVYREDAVPAQILGAHLDGRISLVVSRRVVNELVRELSAKLPAALPTLIASLFGKPPELVMDPTVEEVHQAGTRLNPEDAPIWAAAVNSEAEYFVTGDRTFLREVRAAQTSLTVLTPRELIDRLERSR